MQSIRPWAQHVLWPQLTKPRYLPGQKQLENRVQDIFVQDPVSQQTQRLEKKLACPTLHRQELQRLVNSFAAQQRPYVLEVLRQTAPNGHFNINFCFK